MIGKYSSMQAKLSAVFAASQIDFCDQEEDNSKDMFAIRMHEYHVSRSH